jgi:hypothetical protein
VDVSVVGVAFLGRKHIDGEWAFGHAGTTSAHNPIQTSVLEFSHYDVRSQLDRLLLCGFVVDFFAVCTTRNAYCKQYPLSQESKDTRPVSTIAQCIPRIQGRATRSDVVVDGLGEDFQDSLATRLRQEEVQTA